MREVLVAAPALVIASLGVSCTVGPDYQPPVTLAAPAWPEPMEGGLSSSEVDLRTWWRAFNDPQLDSLVDRALSGSLDLREAAARVREARSLRGVASADLLPSVDARASAEYERSSKNTEFGGPGGSPGETSELYQAGFDASWEIDAFGGIRRAVEAADADLESAVESARNARVTLVSEVARNYVEHRSFQARLAIAEQNVGLQQETLAVSESRLTAGFAGELEVAQARSLLESTRSQIPVLTTGLRQAAFRLDVLLGLPVGTLTPELASAHPV
ncbi:MAG: TolC family protein, partial [Phycisphaerales bacterium]|nr:TolC family protein [Phycisphaerales bacterium]